MSFAVNRGSDQALKRSFSVLRLLEILLQNRGFRNEFLDIKNIIFINKIIAG